MRYDLHGLRATQDEEDDYHEHIHHEAESELCVIEVTPQKDFITYGVGIPLMQMRFPEKARGRAAVAA